MDDEEITLPEFDEKKFMEKERRKAKTSFISFLFGVLIGIICRFLWTNLDSSIRWPLCFLLAVASIGFMARILQFLKIDIKQFSKKEWAGSIAFYLFTWLAIFILAINPPFYDASPPKIEAIALPEIQEENGSILVVAHVTDNSGVKKVTINISGNEYEMEKDEEIPVIYLKEFNLSQAGKNGKFIVKAVDEKGNEEKEELNYSFRKTEELVKVYKIEDEGRVKEIIIEVYKNISKAIQELKKDFRVYYVVNGYEINATKVGESNDGKYVKYHSYPEYKGWEKDTENTIKVYVEIDYYFPGILKKYSNVVYGGEYTFKTSSDENIGTKDSEPAQNLPEPISLRTPGFEFIALMIGIILALYVKRKKQ